VFLKIFFVFLLTFSLLYAKQIPKNILLVHSYHRGYKWSDDISKVLEQKYKSGPNTSLTTVYMDTKKIATPIYFDRLFDLYAEQFKGRHFDLIIASDNNALEFVIRYHESLFKNLPVVFLGINNFDESMIYENNMRQYTTGVAENVDIEKNIDLILKIHKKCKNIVIINDKSKTGYAIKRDIFKVLPKYKKKVNFEYLDDISLKNLKTKIKNLPKNTIILWVLLYKDKTGKKFTYKESLRQVRDISNVPIYGLWDFYLGKGIVGGLLTSATSQATEASKKVDKILKGMAPNQIPILTKSPNEYMFDFNELNRYKIKIDKYIKEYKIINKPFSFYEQYKILVWIILSVFFVLAVFFIFLILNIIKRRKSEIELKNQLKFISVLMDTIPNPINYKDINGKYIGCNMAFAKLFNSNREDIINKTVYDFFDDEWAKEQRIKDEELLSKKGTDNFEKTLHFPDGRARIVSYSKTAYENIDGNIGGIVTIMDDITQRNQQKEFIIQQSKLAEMGEMIAAIAHQWNEPLVELSAILQDLEFSYKQKELNVNVMREFVRESMVQIQYMSKTLSDFRNFLKPSTKKATFCAKKALDEVLEIISRQIFYAHIKLSVTCKDDFVPIYGYKNEFKQVLLNIINNAKHKLLETKNGKNIDIVIEPQSKNIKIKIIDDGNLIDDDVLDLIFDPYFSTNKKGTGLGLYMAKVIIEDKMNGKISAYNYLNKVIFNIIVPSEEEAE